jgi:hypothetical protein
MALQRTRPPSPSLGLLASLARLAAERPTVRRLPSNEYFVRDVDRNGLPS